jgi:acetyl/propionyl-CoA carboxylase alpha subunit
LSSIRPIRRLAIVNRGEAALRCIRTVKSLRVLEGSDLRVVAMFTDVDREAPFVRHADEAVRLATRATPVASYLDHAVVIESLARVEADAVWPGWGFVAESPEFVERVVTAGLKFLGPSAATMRALGDKIAAKLLAERLGVPVTAWSGGVVEDADAAMRAAARIGGTVVVKASAGGGGRGIRVVEDLARLPAAFESAHDIDSTIPRLVPIATRNALGWRPRATTAAATTTAPSV